MIHVEHLTKTYGSTRAVDDLTFEVRPGIVTGFLGPNGAGKSTTMRMILGLDRPTSGRATVNGKVLADHPAPLTQIGSLLEAKAIHPKRSARNHLLALAATTGIGARRVDEVLVRRRHSMARPTSTAARRPRDPMATDEAVAPIPPVEAALLRTHLEHYTVADADAPVSRPVGASRWTSPICKNGHGSERENWRSRPHTA